MKNITKKDNRIVLLSKKLGNSVTELREIEEAEQTLANRKRAVIGKIDSTNKEIALLADFDENLKFKK